MKITFSACTNRGGSDHEHEFIPEYGRHYGYTEGGWVYRHGVDVFRHGPARWVCGKLVPGRVQDLGLTGCYNVYLEFEDAELENWLKNYIDTKPQEALDLLAKMRPRAVDKLVETKLVEKLKAED